MPRDDIGMDEAAARLVDAVQALSRSRDLRTIQAIVRTAARELTGADGATFVLRDEGCCYYADEDAIAPLWKGQRFPLSACISGWAMLNRQHTVIPDIYADDRIPHDAYRPTFVKSLVMVPIRDTEPIGAIGNYWADAHAATPQEVALLQALANSTAIAMENVAVLDQLEARVADRTAELVAANAALEELSTVDELTGLLNRRGFMLLARQQLEAIRRSYDLGALVFVDVDGLKQLNDTKGHEAGDALLQMVASALRYACRGADVLARLGGDEFVILAAPPADLEPLRRRLRAAVESSGRDALGRRPSASMGFALVHPGDHRPLEGLLAEADAAMYAEKQARVGVAS
jgi:diguanylate cyclase (GGDEF)-like protein